MGRKVAVIGQTCSGKTTLAGRLAEHYGVPHVELDALFWGPNWTQPEPEAFRQSVQAAMPETGWVVDGNYAKVRDLLWERAEAVVWLDLPLRTVLRRYLVRTVRRVGRREELWSGNRERLSTHLFSRDSLLWWILSRRRAKSTTP